MNPLDFVGSPDWRSLVLAAAITAPWLILLAGKRLGRWETWAVVAAGIVLFPLSIAWVQVPIQQGITSLYGRWLSLINIQRYSLLLSIPVVVVSGLVQETVKYGIAVLGLRWTGEKDTPLAGLALGAAAGAGYGGMEAFWVFNLIFAAGFTWATVQLAGVAALLGFVERFFAVMFHVSLTALSAYGYTTGRSWQYLLLAIILHSLANYFAVFAQAGVISVAGVEIILALISLATLAAALWLRARERPAAPTDTESEP